MPPSPSNTAARNSTRVPVDAGQSKDVKLKVRPPNTAAAGNYKVTARVAAEDASATDRSRPRHHRPAQARHQRPRGPGLDAAPRPARRPRSRSSSPIPAPRRPKRSSSRGSAPSGWKITFEPKTVDRIAPNENKEVQALITPTDKAIAGDYVDDGARLRARRVGLGQLPRHGDDLDACGASPASASSASRCWSWSARWRGSAGDERHRHRGQGPHQALRRRDRRRRHLVRGRRAARFSGCSAPTAPARPRPS